MGITYITIGNHSFRITNDKRSIQESPIHKARIQVRVFYYSGIKHRFSGFIGVDSIYQ